MALNFQNLDTISFTEKSSTKFATEISEDGRISILTENNTFIYTLMNYMSNEFCDMAFRKNVINMPPSSLREELGNDFAKNCDTITAPDLNKLMQNLDLNAYAENPTYVEVKPIAVKWSPQGLQGKSYCVLAVLNNLYGLSIVSEYRDVTDCREYFSVSNVTRHIVKQASEEWSDTNDIQNKPSEEEWRRRIMATCPKAFTWSHLINNQYAILFVAYPQGSVTSWKFTRLEENSLESKPLQFMGLFMSSLENISAMHWIKYSRNEGALCLGNKEGMLSAVRVSNMNSEKITYSEEKLLRAEDKMKKINYITSVHNDSYSFVIAADDTFIHIFPVLEDGTVLEEVLFNTGSTATTGLCHYKDNILLLLTAGRVRKLTLKLEDGKAELEEDNVLINFDDTLYKGSGIILSKNRAYLGIMAYPCWLRDITRQPTPSKFFIYHDTSESPLNRILSITDKSLADYWDIFEVLRVLSYKNKKFPWEGIGRLDYDRLTLTQLKSLRWIAKMSENIYNIVPKIDGYDIKAYILLHHMVTIQLVVHRMRRLLNDIFQGKELTVFQMRSLDISNMYLKEMVLMKILQKCKVGERFVDDIIGVMEMANEIEYPDMPPCFWCGEKIIGPTCLKTHKDSRCSISMMQIYLTPGFKCPYCECVAHAEMAKEYDIVTCPYCDVPMYQRYSSEHVRNVLENTHESNRKKMELVLQVDAPEDISYNMEGIPEEVSLEDLEDPVEYLALSDSDEEDIVRERMETIRKEFCNPRSETFELAEDSGTDSHVKTDNQGKDDDSSDDYSFGEEEDCSTANLES